MNQLKYNRILLTGAAGMLGSMLRTRLLNDVDYLRTSDINALPSPAANEDQLCGDLADPMLAKHLVKGVDAILHFGGISTEAEYASIEKANISGSQYLYQAAKEEGVERIVFASSNHAIGFYDQTETIDTHAPTRPDSFYGLSKVFTENLAQLYWDKYGLETVSLRIGSCLPKPEEVRHLKTWLSYDDLYQLVIRSLSVPRVKHTIIYAVSDNDECFWDNRYASHLGYHPKDKASDYSDKLSQSSKSRDKQIADNRYQGGTYTEL